VETRADRKLRSHNYRPHLERFHPYILVPKYLPEDQGRSDGSHGINLIIIIYGLCGLVASVPGYRSRGPVFDFWR
jgi:hypothetical protein